MFRWLAEAWMLNDSLPDKVNLVVIISHGATDSRLTKGSRTVTHLARCVALNYSSALIYWGSFSGNFKPEIEITGKEQMLKTTNLMERSVYVGLVSSSIDECEAVIKAAFDKMVGRNVLIVCEGAHSRRCRRVWEYFLPDVHLYFRSVPPWEAADKENPMWLQRYWRVWLLANIVANGLLYRWKPILRWLIRKNFSQPVS